VVQDTRPVPVSVSRGQKGGYGNDQPNAVDSEEYNQRFYRCGVHAGSDDDPLVQWCSKWASKPYAPTRLPEEIVREQIVEGDVADSFAANASVTLTPAERVDMRLTAAVEKRKTELAEHAVVAAEEEIQ